MDNVLGHCAHVQRHTVRLGVYPRRAIRGRGEHLLSVASELHSFFLLQDKGFKSMGIDDDQLRQQAERNAANAAISHVVAQHTSSVSPAPSAPATMSMPPHQQQHAAGEDEAVRLVMSSAGASHDI